LTQVFTPGRTTAEVFVPGRRTSEVLILLTDLLSALGIWTDPARRTLERVLMRRTLVLAAVPVGESNRVHRVRREGSG
jgi:hypothetical protein